MDQVEEIVSEQRSKHVKYFGVALLVILIDQISKILVHELMYLHQEITLLGYADGRYGFKLHYLLNPGMAFGIRWDSEFGKLALTAFRIVAMFGIGYYLVRSSRKNIHQGFLIALALILGGAVGNVIDSTFYGVLFQNHPVDSVTPWFHGQVIDMLFFPLFDFVWPGWVPYVGGEEFLFFSPVFNIADSSIFIGVATILLWQKKFFPEAHSLTEEEEEQITVAEYSESVKTEVIALNSHAVNSEMTKQNSMSNGLDTSEAPIEKKEGDSNTV
jgi:signal peptidase II